MNSSEFLKTGIELIMGLILVPYCTWVTLAIFNLKQEQAVMRSEMDLIKEIKDWIRTQKG